MRCRRRVLLVDFEECVMRDEGGQVFAKMSIGDAELRREVMLALLQSGGYKYAEDLMRAADKLVAWVVMGKSFARGR